MWLLLGSPKALQGLTWTETKNMHLCVLFLVSLSYFQVYTIQLWDPNHFRKGLSLNISLIT